ncbi:hypothetical protein N0V93_007632 [Gnomoniopsis smithogilvyi]|uniref:Uncharacterized protein n=1 Tax=Gnomoniopsis smithogilvyi TaxID=1191159 RepID=A0A9W8YQF9_9PEZI|nr:hypothetical protein N0V93_007632 [Gnomoniopsis smithogilvyi]
MSTSSERAPFIEAQFLEDLEAGSINLEAPYEESVVKEVINAFGEAFHDSAVQIRGCYNPNVPLMFRVLFAIPMDVLDIAQKQGWLTEDDPIVQLHKSISRECPRSLDEPEFTASHGFEAEWKFLGDTYSVDQILAIPGMTDGIRANRQRFIDLNLTNVPIMHLHYRDKTVSLYFLAQGPLTKKHLTEVVALAGAPEPTDEVYQNIVGVLLDASYYCTVVMDYETGKILRVEYHLLFPVKLPDEMEIPNVGERLEKFWDVPSYEIEDMDILSFCFGDTPNGQILALRSYCGGLRSLMKAWGIVGV